MKTVSLVLSCSLLLLANTVSAQASDICNPIVAPVSSDTTLVRALTRLAEEYDFKLSLPASLDRPVQIKKSMNLNKLVKYLTSDLNTVLKHRKIEGCTTAVLTHILLLPVGKETDYASIEQPASIQSEDYVFIENMESYVTNVLSGEQNADLERMTPEQRAEFNFVRETLLAQQAEESEQAAEMIEDDDNKQINAQSN